MTCLNQRIFIYSYGRLQRFYSIMGELIGFPLNYAPYVVVQQIQIGRARRPYVWSDMIGRIVTHRPYEIVQSLVGRCTILFCSHSLSNNLLQQHLIISSNDPQVVSKQLRRYDITLIVHNSQNHLCITVIPLVALVVLIKKFFSSEKKQSFPGLWCFSFCTDTDQTVILFLQIWIGLSAWHRTYIEDPYAQFFWWSALKLSSLTLTFWRFLSIIFCTFHTNLGILIVLGPLDAVLHLATSVKSPSAVSSTF